MKTTGKLLVGGIVIAAVAIAGGIGLSGTMQRGATIAHLESLPQDERNLAIFDAACTLIEKHYFNRELFASAVWPEYKAQWREKAAAEKLSLYSNVLENFARRFPDTHVGFLAPEPRSAQSQASTAKQDSQSARRHVDFDKLLKIAQSGPGFDAPQIHRAGVFQAVVA